MSKHQRVVLLALGRLVIAKCQEYRLCKLEGFQTAISRQIHDEVKVYFHLYTAARRTFTGYSNGWTPWGYVKRSDDSFPY